MLAKRGHNQKSKLSRDIESRREAVLDTLPPAFARLSIVTVRNHTYGCHYSSDCCCASKSGITKLVAGQVDDGDNGDDSDDHD